MIPFIVYKHKKICIAWLNCRGGFATVHMKGVCKGETRALIGGGGVNIHIFLFCPTNFFWNQLSLRLIQWTLNIPGRITPMIESMIGWSWRAGKSNFKRTEESSKEWAFFYKLANIGKKFMLFAEMNQYFRVRQDFLFSSNCFTSICSKKVSIFTFIFWKNYKCFDLSKKPLPFN